MKNFRGALLAGGVVSLVMTGIVAAQAQQAPRKCTVETPCPPKPGAAAQKPAGAANTAAPKPAAANPAPGTNAAARQNAATSRGAVQQPAGQNAAGNAAAQNAMAQRQAQQQQAAQRAAAQKAAQQQQAQQAAAQRQAAQQQAAQKAAAQKAAQQQAAQQAAAQRAAAQQQAAQKAAAQKAAAQQAAQQRQIQLQQQQQLKLQQQQNALQQRQIQLQQQQQNAAQQRQLQQNAAQQRQLQMQQQQIQQQQLRLQQNVRNPVIQPGPVVQQRNNGLGVGGAAAIGLGVGLVGGYALSNQVRGYNEVQARRTQVIEGGVTYVQEPGRVIVREVGGPAYIRRNETSTFAVLGYQSRQETVNGQIRTIYDRPDGSRIITVTDGDGRLLRRIRRFPNGREVVIIDNSFRPRPTRFVEQIVVMPPPPMTIPRERYIVDAARADEGTIYETLSAPPLAPIKRRYTLDEVRYSPDLRNQMRSVDVNTITFDTGSWEVAPSQYDRLASIAKAIDRAVQANPQEVFLIEGHTDAVGNQDDNLSLSDRRAEAVSEVLSKNFNVPAENLTTQGYGEQQLRVATDGAARENRRVTVRRITPLLGSGDDQSQVAPADGQAQQPAQ